MKVLVAPPENTWTCELTCAGYNNSGGGCGAVLKVELADLFHVYGVERNGYRDQCTAVKCCVCGVISCLRVENEPQAHIDNTLPYFRDWIAEKARQEEFTKDGSIG